MDTIEYTASADDFPCINSDDIDARPTTETAESGVFGNDSFGPYSDEAARLTIRQALEMLASEANYRADAMAMLSALPDDRPLKFVEKRARRSKDFWMMGQRVSMPC
jgi:hypothetical protein